MSLLNNANDGLHTVLIALFQAITDGDNALSLQVLQSRLQPPNSSDKFDQTLRRWLELGLFVQVGETISIPPKYQRPPSHHMVGTSGHAVWAIRTVALAAENNDRFWEAGQSRAADLTRSIAWLLCQDVYSFDWAAVGELEASQLNDESKRFARNSNRENALLAWGGVLGFLWNDGNAVAIDPTVAIRDVLSSAVGKSATMPIEGFIQAIAAELPVLDQGRYRQEVERHLDPASYPRPSTQLLSPAMSRALLRLQRDRVISLVDRTVDKTNSAVFLWRPTGQRGSRITHVSLGQGN
jgi:hypothetical protein